MRFLLFECKGFLNYKDGTKGFRQQRTELELNLKDDTDYYAYINPEDIKVKVGDTIGNLTMYGGEQAQFVMLSPIPAPGFERKKPSAP